MKKIKVFLGGYVNSTNAQNLNCLALAKHFDKNRYDIGVLTIYSGNLPVPNIDNIKYFHVFYPHRISKYLIYLQAILWADVIYLPKGEICLWNKFWIKLLGKKSFKTVEGIFGKEMLGQILDSGMSYESLLDSFKGYDRVYSITAFLKKYNEEHHGIKTEDKILYLGTDTSLFLNEDKKIDELKNIIFIGRLKKRKGIFDFLEAAKSFPNIHFHIAGNGEEKEAIESFIAENGMKNVSLLGTLSHKELAEKLKQMDLHVFPSRSEGFPKVTLETAASGVPSVVYPDYGAEEWIKSGIDGFIVKDVEDIKVLIAELQKNPKKLREVSKNSIELGKRFDWKIVIKDWESVIEELHESR